MIKKHDKCCGTHKWKGTKLLARLLFLLVHLLPFLLPTGLVLQGSSSALLAHTCCMGQTVAVTGLRVFLGCHGLCAVATYWVDTCTCACLPHLWIWSLNSHVRTSLANSHYERFLVMISQGRTGSTGHSEICLFISCPKVITVLRHLPQAKFAW